MSVPVAPPELYVPPRIARGLEQALTLILLSGALLLPLVWSSETSRIWTTPKLGLLAALIITLAPLLALATVRTSTVTVYWPHVTAASMAIAAGWLLHPRQTLAWEDLGVWATPPILILACTVLPRLTASRVLSQLQSALAFLVPLVAGYGVSERLGWIPPWGPGSLIPNNAAARYPATFFGNANFACFWLVPAVLLVLAQAWTSPSRRWWPILASFIGVVYIIASQSRNAPIGLALGIIFLGAPSIIRLWKMHRTTFRWVAVTAVAITALMLVLSGTAARFAGRAGGTDSAQYRVELWRESLRTAAHSPILGCGIGRLDTTFSANAGPALRAITAGSMADERWTRAHSDFLHVLAETGALGTAAWFGLWLLSGYRLWKHRSTQRGLSAAWLSITVMGLFDNPLFSPASAWLAWLICGIGLRLSSTEAVARPSKWLYAARTATLLTLALTLAGAWSSLRWVLADGEIEQARRKAKSAPALAQAALDHARRLAPEHANLLVTQMTLCRVRGDHAGALAAAEARVAQDPLRSDAWNALAACRAEAGATPETVLQAFDRAYTLSPANGAAALNAALLLNSMQRWKEAVVWFDRLKGRHDALLHRERAQYELAKQRASSP